jgi:hypothetical protein
MKRILILPGGGMKGLSQAVVLTELEKRAGKPLAQCVDMVAGASIGGIMACLLAAMYPMKHTISFFTDCGPRIFKKHWWRMFPIFGPKYSAATLEDVLQLKLGGYRLSDCHTKLLVPTYDLASSQPHFFKSYEHDDAHGNCCLWEVGRATSAAETYFGAYRLNDLVLWDGGNIANNPAVCAYADAVKIWGPHEEFRFLVVNCAYSHEMINVRGIESAGALRLLSVIVNTLFETGAEDVDYQMPRLVGGSNYLSVTPQLKSKIALDATNQNALIILKDAGTIAIIDNSQVLSAFLV